MDKIAILFRIYILFVVMLFSTKVSSQTTLGFYDFESGYQGWTDGGTDAARANNATRSYSGTFSLELRSFDSSGNNSSFISPSFNKKAQYMGLLSL